LVSFVLSGGLRACAIGLDLCLLAMVLWALRTQWQAQRAHGNPGGWLYIFYYDKPMALLAAALACYALVCLVRALLPPKANALTTQARQNFRSFFRIAGVGILLFHACVLFYGFFLVRQHNAGTVRALNLVPFRVIKDSLWGIQNVPGLAYETIVLLAGNVFLFFLPGFFLRGLFKRAWWQTLLFCGLFSAAMEALQWLLRVGQADVDDLLLNVFGAALGVLAAWLLGFLRKKITRGAEGIGFLSWSGT
ncbi:MAG: VanZ family protein, partial [Oscillospiraceae bacterium]|nr:VanZ family protein [Oscillospiraceae bacterium]